jgi:hypothetical protein
LYLFLFSSMHATCTHPAKLRLLGAWIPLGFSIQILYLFLVSSVNVTCPHPAILCLLSGWIQWGFFSKFCSCFLFPPCMLHAHIQQYFVFWVVEFREDSLYKFCICFLFLQCMLHTHILVRNNEGKLRTQYIRHRGIISAAK